LIGHGTGLVNVNGAFYESSLETYTDSRSIVEFRLVVFRPFKGEVMLGRIRSCKPEGIHRGSTVTVAVMLLADVSSGIVRTDFFDEIFVPCEELPEGAE
jgi:DNA-directed RNA polymerase III subunit RPC8